MKSPTLLPRLVLAALLCGSFGSLRAEDKPAADIPPSVLKRYDKNKDGALDETEKAKWEADKAAVRDKKKAEKAAMLEKYDTNKNGRLDEEEQAAAKLGREKERSVKEAEKMKERSAKLKAEKEKAEKEKAEKQAAEKASEKGQEASAAKSENASEKSQGKGPKDKKGKPGEDEMMDGAMME